ncbi:alpha-2-macroglobulin family protein [Parashewanella spongiae]|uniref:Alpha-2-macroglobulin n=1 Tax=Parashewanella spongiae TaxID=342950 RepID=A0A3A6TBX0_9GAMM|nr:alpha-2-macroglobulin [Parashewanella spongiae]MCL1079652.1 alpha-2-macroglobulin family protein [Parashewanella spongiae]RJY07119.1 alpha-2-macroglobulin family protein [Parashewanella spongiae]
MKLIKSCLVFSVLLILSACQPAENEASATPKRAAIEQKVSAHTPLVLQDISEREQGAQNALSLLFSIPLNPDQNFSRYIVITPQLPTPVLSENGRTLNYFGLSPDTQYQVQVMAGLVAVNQQTLHQGSHKSIKSRAMSAMVGFETQGAVMVPGKAESLPVIAVNVPEAEFNLYRVKNDSVAKFFEYVKYYNIESLQEMLTHVYTSRIEINDKKNVRNRVLLDVNHYKPVKEAGIYFATLARPGQFKPDAKTWFSISAIGLQLRKYPSQTRLIAQDINSGELLSDVDIQILNRKSKLWGKGKTDKEGAFVFSSEPSGSYRQRPTLILAKKDNQTTVLEVQGAEFDLSKFDVSGRPTQSVEFFVYSPRNIYRPGEKVNLSVLKRGADGENIGGRIYIELRKPDGQVFNQWQVTATADGYYQLDIALPNAAQLGQWQFVIKTSKASDQAERFRFSVEEFLPDRLKLNINRDDKKLHSFVKGQTPIVDVQGDYLYGAPAAGNRLDTQVRLSSYVEPFSQWPKFMFGDKDAKADYPIDLPTAKLNERGGHQTKLSTDIGLKQWQVPTAINLNYSLYESGGRAVNRSTRLLYWPKAHFAGVRPLFSDDRASQNEQAKFELINTDENGSLVAGSGNIKLYREEKQYFWSFTQSRGWHYEVKKNEYLAASDDVRFSTTSPVSLAMPVEWGRYRLEVTNVTSQAKTIYRFDAGKSWYANWNNNGIHIRPDRVTLALDKAAYHGGETAKVRIAAPTNGKALLLLETDTVISSTMVELADKQAEASFTIPEGIGRHDVYLSAFVVAPGSDSQQVAKRSFGVIPVKLVREQRQLSVDIDVPESWRPNQTVQAVVSVDSNNTKQQQNINGGEIYVTLSAVDQGILNVTGYRIGNPFDFFYRQHQYSAVIRDMFDQVLSYDWAQQALQRWGGDADLTRGGAQPKNQVQMVSLFSGLVKIKQGKAQIPLVLPQFEGQLKLTAVAFSGDRFGKAEQQVNIASPVVAQLATPKFLATNDSTQLALDLVNMTDTEQQIDLAISTSGAVATLAVTDPLKFSLAPNVKQTIKMRMLADTQAGTANINAEIKINHETLKRHWSIGVRQPQPAIYQQNIAAIGAGGGVEIDRKEFSDFIPESVELQLQVASQPELSTAENWRYLNQYPYACLEQTASKTNPIAAAAFAHVDTSRFKQDETTSENASSSLSSSQKVTDGMNRFAELQLANGGFALWSADGAEEHWLTAYATETLIQLAQAGYSVPNNLLSRAQKRLQTYINARSPLYVRHWSQAPSHYQLAYKTYAAYLLAQSGKVALGPLRDIAERELNNAQSPLQGVQLGLAMMYSGSKAEGEKIIAKALKKHRHTSIYLGDYGSVIRDEAMLIHALISADVMVQKAMERLLDLQTLLNRASYLSTQERSSLFRLSMILEQQATADDWHGELQVGTNKQQIKQAGRYLKTLAVEAESEPIRFINQTDNSLFAGFIYSGVRKQPQFELNRGIKVRTRHYLLKSGMASALEDLSDLHIGDLVLTRVNMQSNERISDALLVNLMPAGLELENQNLEHALKLSNLTIDGKYIKNNANIEYQAFRDDRYVAALDLPKGTEQTLYFISRAVNPGVYQVPPALVESMYRPQLRGIGNHYQALKVME